MSGHSGTHPAEGTRRRLILGAVESVFDGATSPGPPSDVSALDVADAIEAALLGAEPEEAAPVDELLDIAALVEKLDVATDRERGQLLELAGQRGSAISGEAVGRIGSQVGDWPPDHRGAALLLTVIGLVDQLTLERDRLG